MNNPQDYYLHSGGAKGADTVWAEIGMDVGIPEKNIKHWRPKDYYDADLGIQIMINTAVANAAQALGRPTEFKGIDLVKRNYFQVAYSYAVFAISTIVYPGQKDFKGFTNKNNKAIVAGGTGWAVEMAIQANIPVYVFDMNSDHGWYYWKYKSGTFEPLIIKDLIIPHTPTLNKKFAGIGSRDITEEGIQAIKNVYEKTFR